MRYPTQLHCSFKILIPACLALALSGCFQVQLNGPVGGAALTLATSQNPGVILQTATSKDEAALIEELGEEQWSALGPVLQLLYLGTAEFDTSALSDFTLYLVTASGGLDYDYDHDGVRDAAPTPVAGSWRMLVTGAQLKSGFARINPLTEASVQLTEIGPPAPGIAFVRCEPLLGTENCFSSNDLDARSANAARLLTDVDGDGVISAGDLLRWTRAGREQAYRWGNDALDYLAESIRTGTALDADLVAERVFRATPLADLEFSDASLAACIARSRHRYAHQHTVLECPLFSSGAGTDANPIVNLDGVQALTGLHTVNLFQHAISSVAPLVELEHLRRIRLGSVPLSATALAELRGSASIDTLLLYGMDVGNAGWLQDLPRLRYLVIRGPQPGNDNLMDALARLDRLVGLGLDQGAATQDRLATLAALPGLQRLSLRGNSLTDVSVLSTLVDLEWLDIGSNQLTSIEALRELTDLQHLGVSHNTLSSLEPVLDLKTLNVLEAEGCGLDTLPTLSGLTQLERLMLSQNELQSLEGIQQLPSLVTLIISFNQVADLSPLRELTSLQNLSAPFNAITDLSPLEQLTGLRSLQVQDNRISSLAPLAALQQLSSIVAENNRLTSTTGLSGLQELRSLSLGGNQIVDLSLDELPKLGWLDLDGNAIATLEGIGTLPALQYMSLKSNELVSVGTLTAEKTPRLSYLDLDGNSQLSCEAVEALLDRFGSAQVSAADCLSP